MSRGPALPSRARVVIVGGGFGGIAAARALRRAPVDITLIDRNNHHLFQPLLYQVASAVLPPSDITRPIRRVLRGQRNVRVIMGEVHRVDSARRVVVVNGDERELPYDYLIVAAGLQVSYFGHGDWARLAPGLKSVADAEEIRRRFLTAFEEAEKTDDQNAHDEYLTFVIVGGGPTGVELAGLLLPTAESLPVARTRDGRVRVEPDLSIAGHPEVFVIGDLAAVRHPTREGLVPGVAPAANQEGRLAARNIIRSLHGRSRRTFRYFDKGMLATIGRHKAVGAFRGITFRGYIAWWGWLLIHILYLAGFRNRVSVMLEWMYAYFTFERGSRLISAPRGSAKDDEATVPAEGDGVPSASRTEQRETTRMSVPR